MVILISIYILMVIVTFVALIKYQQKTTGHHNDDVLIVAYLVFSVLWFFYLPMLAVFLLAKSFVKLITGGVK